MLIYLSKWPDGEDKPSTRSLNLSANWLLVIVDFPSWLWVTHWWTWMIEVVGQSSPHKTSDDPQRTECEQVVASLSLLMFWLVWGQSRLQTVNWSRLYSGSLPSCVLDLTKHLLCASPQCRRMNSSLLLCKSKHFTCIVYPDFAQFSYLQWLLISTNSVMRKWIMKKSLIHTGLLLHVGLRLWVLCIKV